MSRFNKALPYFLGVMLIAIAVYIWSLSLKEKVGEMHEHGMCTIGRLSRVTMNSSYYNFLSNGIEVNANNGVVVNPSKIDSLFPIVYVRTAPQEGYLVNYKGDLSKYKYGDDVCCELCSEIKSKISYWDM